MKTTIVLQEIDLEAQRIVYYQLCGNLVANSLDMVYAENCALTSREQGGRPMSDRLADELMAAFRKEGKAMATRDNTHRMADANKAFAHFAW